MFHHPVLNAKQSDSKKTGVLEETLLSFPCSDTQNNHVTKQNRVAKHSIETFSQAQAKEKKGTQISRERRGVAPDVL